MCDVVGQKQKTDSRRFSADEGACVPNENEDLRQGRLRTKMKMKKFNILIFSVLLLSSCTSVYEPGDIYKGNGYEAVVFAVDADNRPVAVMSLDEASSLDADSALRWVEEKGDGWRLPDRKEIAMIDRTRSLINATLERKGLPPVMKNATYYWSSTPCSETHSYACGPDGVGCYYNENNSSVYRARAVRTIDN